MTVCYIERSKVREILIGQPDENLDITELILSDVDALPILTAADIAGVAQSPPKAECEYCKKWHDPRVACPEYAAVPSTRQNTPPTKAWSPDQFWEYAEGLTDAFVRDQMRDTMAERGLAVTSTEQKSP